MQYRVLGVLLSIAALVMSGCDDKSTIIITKNPEVLKIYGDELGLQFGLFNLRNTDLTETATVRFVFTTLNYGKKKNGATCGVDLQPGNTHYCDVQVDRTIQQVFTAVKPGTAGVQTVAIGGGTATTACRTTGTVPCYGTATISVKDGAKTLQQTVSWSSGNGLSFQVSK